MSGEIKTFARGLMGAALVLAAGAAAAEAKCSRLAFSVNDYGKEGPTKDAKNLLDKHIVSWTAARGITKYTTGKKDVTCELFLDFGVFDEHTCKASATVCWADGPGTSAKAKGALPPAEAPAVRKTDPAKKSATPAKPAAPKVAPGDAPAAPAPAKTKPKAA